jgi:glycosyltransferase involved in cell wall biosynthesis
VTLHYGTDPTNPSDPLLNELVSIVTPFRNTVQYLEQCIESVLTQSYTRFEYILSDNGSTDGSTDIAEAYACRDPRIRLIRQPSLLSQVEHYNQALMEISDSSQYCKMVQADDYLFPDCLRSMVNAFRQSESIGLVSSYDLKANIVRGSGFPYLQSLLSGKDAARLTLRNVVFPFGSPTTVMYRSSLVRDCQPFFDKSLLHEDTEKCMQILQHWDFGFVYQVLSFLRTENTNDSISADFIDFQPNALDRYILVQRYAPIFLEANEAKALRSDTKRSYYRILALAALKFRELAFWRYHKAGLKTFGESVNWLYLMIQIGRESLWMVVNPGATLSRAFSAWNRRMRNTDRGVREMKVD